jgi:hypothetical protein
LDGAGRWGVAGARTAEHFPDGLPCWQTDRRRLGQVS